MKDRYTPPKYVILASDVREAVAKKLSQKYNMAVFGMTGGLAERVNLLGLSFQVIGPLSKEKIREMIVDCTEYFLATINADEQIRPYLKNYPFTAKEIDLALFLRTSSGESLYEPEISLGSLSDGEVSYWTHEKGKVYEGTNIVYETYEDALKIVLENKKSNNL